MINGVVALFIGLYLVLVLWRGNEGRMISVVSAQVGFFKWAGAILTLTYLYNAIGGKAGEIIRGLITLALIAMILLNGKALFAEVQKVFDTEPKNEGLAPVPKIVIKTASDY